MKKLNATNTSTWARINASTLLLLFCCFTTNAQDCFFTTSYEIIDIANNGDGTCDYTIDLCAEVDENAVVHSIDYSVLFDNDGDGDEESIVTYNFTPGIQIPNGTYCLSSSAPAQTFTITTPCGNEVMLVVTGINNTTNEECMNLIEEIVLEAVEDEDIAEMQNNDELLMPEETEQQFGKANYSTTSDIADNYTLYPSIAQTVVNLQIAAAYEAPMNWMVTDINGQVLMTVLMEAGRTEKQVAVDQLHSGYYYLVPQDKTAGLSAKQFVKL